MKNENLFKLFARYVSLNVLGMIALSCYILADTFFVSKALGAAGLAALNLAIPVYNFIHGSGLMIGMGGGTKYSIFKSQGRREVADQIFTNAAVTMLCIAAVFFFAGFFASGPLARLLGANDQTYDMARVYLQVIMLFTPMFMLNNLLLCFVRNDGAPQLAMAAMITGSLSNVVLDYIFMFPFGMGIFGAVLATGLAPVISIWVMSPYFLKKKNQFHLRRCRILPRRIGGIFSSGLPSLITEVSSGIVIIVFNKIILGIEGNTGVAAYGVIANLSLVVVAIYTGIAQGIQPVISSQYGGGNKKAASAVLRYALVTMTILSVVVYLFIFMFAPQIAQVFNSENSALLQEIAVGGLKVYFIGCIFAGFNIIVSMYFTSTEYPLPAHVISILRGFGVIIPAAFILSALAGMNGVWSAFPVTEALVAVIGAGLLLRKLRRAQEGRKNRQEN